MRILEVLSEATTPYIHKVVDPALLTYREFYELVNPNNKHHSESAYQSIGLQSLNNGSYGRREDYKLMRRIKIKGLTFEICSQVIDCWETAQYVKRDPNGEIVRINNEAQYYTREEVEKLGFNRWDYRFAIFDTETKQMVGWTTDDEWGCHLVVVAPEYRGMGFGTILTKLMREQKPDLHSGGFSPSGARNFDLVHQEFVRDYLKTGMYSQLIRQGVVTKARVQEIVHSAFPKGVTRPKKSSGDLSSANPENWLLYAQDGAFVLYDRKLADLVQEDDMYWTERMVKGYVYVGPFSRDDWGHIKIYGAETEKLKKFLMMLALSYCEKQGISLVIENDQKVYLPDDVKILKYGPDRMVVKPVMKYVPYEVMAKAEVRYRRAFDRYGEFHDRLLEIAEGKYQQSI